MEKQPQAVRMFTQGTLCLEGHLGVSVEGSRRALKKGSS